MGANAVIMDIYCNVTYQSNSFMKKQVHIPLF